MKKITKRGFTLIELLVVVAIIAILALIVLLALNPVEMARRSRDSRRLSDLGTLRSAIDLALADGETLPGSATAPVLVTLSSTISTRQFPGGTDTMDISKYLSVVPQDPYNGSNNPQTITDGYTCTTGTAVRPVYTFWSNGDTYELNAYLESTENCNAVVSDGGNSSALYEIGTHPGLDGI